MCLIKVVSNEKWVIIWGLWKLIWQNFIFKKKKMKVDQLENFVSEK